MNIKLLSIFVITLCVLMFVYQVSAELQIRENLQTNDEVLRETLEECLEKCKNRHYLKDPCVIRCHVLHPFSSD